MVRDNGSGCKPCRVDLHLLRILPQAKRFTETIQAEVETRQHAVCSVIMWSGSKLVTTNDYPKQQKGESSSEAVLGLLQHPRWIPL